MVSDDADKGLRALMAWGEIVAQTGSFEHVPATGRLVWSDNLARIFGFEAGASPSVATVLAAVHPDDRERVAAAIARRERTGEVQVTDHRITRPDGEGRYLRMTLAMDEPHGERPDHMIGVVRDITESGHAEREIADHVAVKEGLVDCQEFESGARRLMARLALALECLAGVLWVPADDVLVPRVFWQGDPVDADFAEAAPGLASLSPGIGLAGRVWQTGQPSTRTEADVAAARLGDRASAAELVPSHGLVGAMAVPVVDGREVIAVIELRADREIVLGDPLTRSLCGISHDLGAFLARRGGELAAPLPAGQDYVDRRIAQLPGRADRAGVPHISKREAQVLGLLSQGSTTEQVAQKLFLSAETVQTHVRNATRKLGAHGRLHAVILALVGGDIELPAPTP